MIRYSLLVIFLAALWIYVFRDWFISLCGLIVLTALMQRGDMPTQMAGIQGMNPWNLTLLIITVGWAVERFKTGSPWNAPPAAIAVVLAYVGLIVVGYARAMLDVSSFPASENISLLGLTSDELVNRMKYFWAAFMLADGCRTPGRARLAILVILAVGVVYAAFLIKKLPLDALRDSDGILHMRRRIDKEIGLHANDMAKVLVLTFWGIVVAHGLWPGRLYKLAAVAGGLMTLLGIALCFSRAGYVTWVGVGLLLGVLRWRKLLLLLPVGLIVVCIAMPSVVERTLTGFDSDGASNEPDTNEITAGRTGNLWPPTIDAIMASPLIGYGRLGIYRSSAYDGIVDNIGYCPASPHNGYLEVMIDHGLIGMIIVLALFGGAGVMGLQLMRSKANPLLLAVGSLAVVHVSGCLINALSGAFLFPDQGMLGTFCALGITLRVWCAQRHHARVTASNAPRHVHPAGRPAAMHMRWIAR